MTDSLYQRTGQMRMPALASDVDDADLTLAPLDPARDTFLELLKAAINFELGAAWAKVVAVVPQLSGKLPVSDTWPGPPSAELMRQRAASLPMLFVSRDGDGLYEYQSLSQRQLRQNWEIHYALLPLETGETRKLQDVLTRVGDVIDATIERGGHPAYQGGAKVLYSVGFATIELKRVRKGQAKFSPDPGTPTYLMLTAEVESTEVRLPLDGTATDWRGVGWSISAGNADGLVQPFIQFDSETYQPTMEQWAVATVDLAGLPLGTGSDTLVTPGGDTLLNQ